MKIISIVIFLIIFSSVATLFNTLGIYDQHVYEPVFSVPQSDIDSLFHVDGNVQADQSIWDMGKSLVDGTIKFVYLLANTFALALNLGGLFSTFIPGVVGEQLAFVINGITRVFYLIAGVQIWRKISFKGME